MKKLALLLALIMVTASIPGARVKPRDIGQEEHQKRTGQSINKGVAQRADAVTEILFNC